MPEIIRSTADSSGFIPEFWAQQALDVLRQQIVLAQIVAKDTDFTETGYKGKALTIPYPGTFKAEDKEEGTPITPQVPEGGTSVRIELSKHKVIPFLISDFAAAQASSKLMDRYLNPAVVGIAEQFESDLSYTASSLGTIAPEGTGGTNLSSGIALTAMQRLNEAKAPRTNRYLVVSPKDEAALLADEALKEYWAFSQSDAIRNGYTGRLYGMDVFWTQMAPLGYTLKFGSGAVTLTFAGQDTSALATGSTAAQVQTALEGLSTVGSGNVKVTGPTGGPFSIIFHPDVDVTGTLTAAGTGNSLKRAQKNFALQQNGIIFATRMFDPIPDNAGVMTAQVSDEESGLSIRLSAQYDINSMGVRANLDILYGTAVLRPSQGIVLDA